MRRILNSSGLLIAALAVGCAERPTLTYDAPAEVSDFAGSVLTAENECLLLNGRVARAEIGCAVAIAKIAPTVMDPDDPVFALTDMSPGEQAYWVEALRGFSLVREPQFPTRQALRPQPPSIAALCTTARQQRASLLLVYSPSRFGMNSAEVVGVVYDVQTVRPLATLHASESIVDESGDERPLDEKIGDHRKMDAYFQACRAFEARFLDCLSSLVTRDARIASK